MNTSQNMVLVEQKLPNHTFPVDPTGEESFLVDLARALHAAGTPAYRLEEAIQTLGHRLATPVQVLSTPTALQLAFGTHSDRCRMTREQTEDVHLARVYELNRLIEQVQRGEISYAAAHFEVKRIVASPPPHRDWAVCSSFSLASASAACFFGGGALEVAIAGLIGLVVGLLSCFGRSVQAIDRLFTPLAAALAAVLALAAHRWIGDLAHSLVTLSSLIVLVPGLTITVAMGELVTRHLISGTSRFAQAAISLLGIGFGLALGRAVFFSALGIVDPPLAASPSPLPYFVEVIALFAAPIAFTVLFQARWKDAGWILAASLFGFFAARWGASWLGPALGASLGSLAVGVFGNSLSRLLGLPASIPTVPGIMLLVPGSLGFRSIDLFLTEQVMSGMESAMHMSMVAVSLVAGLLFANALVPPRRDL